MKLKLDDKGAVALENGFPVWVADDGKEIAYDVPKLVTDLSRVNSESAGRRKEIDALNEKFKAYEGLDLDKAKSALETVANLDAGKLMDAGKVEELKGQIAKSFEAKIADLEKARLTEQEGSSSKLKAKDDSIRRLLVKGAFDASTFLREKTVLPPDLAYQSFGQNFEVVEEGGDLKVVAKVDGKPVFSRANPGTPATTEEAIEAIIESYPMKDRILRTTQGGSGSQPTHASGDTGGKTMTRTTFEALPPADKAKFFADKGTLTD